MFDIYCYRKEISVQLYEERRGFKVDAIRVLIDTTQDTISIDTYHVQELAS